jgi:hypothetical protein
MSQINDFELCRLYLINYIANIKQELNYYERKLVEQTEVCPTITSITLEQIDHNLKQFVDRERSYLFRKNEKELKKFKENIQNNQTFGIITTYRPTIDQVCRVKISQINFFYYVLRMNLLRN